jgi:translation initiation factor 2 subunit 3
MTNENLPELTIGIVGHIDHGKTTLLSKLSGKWSDTHSEEMKRGITIKLGYADMTIYEDNGKFNIEKKGKPVRYVSFIDNPGHEMLMATTLSGSAIIDAAILVVAANEGIKPQTREHLMALQAKHVKNIIIVQNKIDIATKEKTLQNYKDIKNLIKGTIAENAKIIPISAQQDINLDKIYEELTKIEIPKRNLDSNPIFLVARSFDINRPGKEIEKLNGGVLGGSLKQGKLKVGDEIEIKPGLFTKKNNQVSYQTITTKINSLFKGSNKVDEVTPGASISIETELDPTLTKTDSLTGSVVSLKGTLPEITNKIKIKATKFEKTFTEKEEKIIENFKPSEMLMLSVNTTITVGTVQKISGDTLELNLNIPIVALKGDTLGIARNLLGHWRLIGFGEIVE